MLKGLEINIERLRREIVADRKEAEIARQLGIRPTYLYRKLNGTVAMTLKDLNNICRIYGMSATKFADEIEKEEAA